ncbi:MAG: glycosyltransferase family 4 protein [Candidatus Sumerlaeaceae bacterium]
MSISAPPPQVQEHRLRVLQLCAVDFTAKQFLLPLAHALMNNGYDVDIACARGPYFDQIRDAGFNMIENPISRNANLLHHARSLRGTYKLIKRGKYHVVHVHTPIAALLGRIAARLAGVPVKIYTAHGFYFHDQMKPWLRRALITLEKIGSACGDFIMTVSKEDEQSAIRLGIASEGRVETIYNGVDVERFDPQRFAGIQRSDVRQSLGIPDDAYVIGIVGRLVREKGFFELFSAAKVIVGRYPHVRVLVVGDVLPSDYDGSKHEVHATLRELGIANHVVFAGMVDDTAPYLHAMDAFTLPSYREGMPVSLLEAMAMELPAVATDIRGCREEVVHGETGWLVPSKDASALADRLSWLVEHPAEAADMGRRGRARVLEHFDLAKVVAHELQIYNKLIAGRDF